MHDFGSMYQIKCPAISKKILSALRNMNTDSFRDSLSWKVIGKKVNSKKIATYNFSMRTQIDFISLLSHVKGKGCLLLPCILNNGEN